MGKGCFKVPDQTVEKDMLASALSDKEGRKAYDEFMRIYEFKRAVVNARKERNMTQKEVAASAGLTQQMVSKIETGDCYCNFASILKYLSVVDPEKKLLTV